MSIAAGGLGRGFRSHRTIGVDIPALSSPEHRDPRESELRQRCADRPPFSGEDTGGQMQSNKSIAHHRRDDSFELVDRASRSGDRRAAGIGLAVVERFLAEGACVGVLDRSEGDLATIGNADGRLIAVTGDVTSYADNVMAVRETVDAFGKLDVFVGNAGIFDYFAPLVGFDGADLSSAFDEIFAVNVKGYLLGARAAVPELLKSDGPSMIFTVSNSGFYASSGGPLYTASKHAVVGVVRELAYELAPKIRVNGVAPGGTVTGLRGIEDLGGVRTCCHRCPASPTL